MSRTNIGRPPNEVSAWSSIRGNPTVRPFTDFGNLGTADDTGVLQDAIDWSASPSGGPVGGPGQFIVNGLIIRDGAHIICPGRRYTKFVPKIGVGFAKAPMLLDTGPVQNVVLKGFTLDATVANNTGQHGIYFLAMPTLVSSAWQGGLWYSHWEDLLVQGFTGEQIWLHASGDEVAHPFSAPHQFGNMMGVVALTASTTRRALRLTGQVGQFDYDAACEFDGALGGGAGRLIGTENILIERGVDRVTFVNNSDQHPYTHNFLGTSIQSNTRGATVERGTNINFIGAHLEECVQGVLFDVQAYGNNVRSCYFGNVGHDFHGSIPGYGVKATGGSETSVLCDGNIFNGTTDTHFVCAGGAQLLLGSNRHTGDTIRTSGVTAPAIAAAATLVTQSHRLMWVNGGGSTVITTISSDLEPDQILTIRANAGRLLFGTSGNINPGAYGFPLIVPQDGSITLMRNDLSGIWLVIGISGRQDQGHKIGFVNAAMSPYTVLPTDATVRVDASAGAVSIVLGNRIDYPEGWRCTVKKLDSTANGVAISGQAGQPIDGVGTVTLNAVNQTVIIERNSLGAGGAWDVLAGKHLPITRIWPGFGLSLRDHATPATILTSFDGTGPTEINLNVDGSSANLPNTLMARDGGGGVHASMFFGDTTGFHTGNISGSAATAASLLVAAATISGAGSSPALHAVIAYLNAITGGNITDATTP